GEAAPPEGGDGAAYAGDDEAAYAGDGWAAHAADGWAAHPGEGGGAAPAGEADGTACPGADDEAADRGESGGVADPGENRGGESVLTVRASVAPGGTLEYLPEPMVVADGARHVTDIGIELAAGASLVLRDEIVLGRHGERGGACRTRLRVDYDGRPLLRHDVAVDGTDEVSLGPAVLAGHRAHGTLLRAGPAADRAAADGAAASAPAPHANESAVAMPIATSTAHPSGAAPNVAVMRLAGPGVLLSALAPDSLTLRRLLAGK
ncbi:MAG: urease accessory protein UreD, partial [Nocardiopsaceae bacterium]|nr:urease accessory protein UreD [Nocardiopsaceae bacterium]